MGKRNNSSDTNKLEIKKDRGDNLKKFAKYKGTVKKDEIPKDLVKDRGDSNALRAKTVKERFNEKAAKRNSLDNNDTDKSTELLNNRVDSLVTQNKSISKNIKCTEAVSKSNIILSKRNISIEQSSSKTPTDLTTDGTTKLIDVKPLKNKNLEKCVALLPKRTKNKDVVSESNLEVLTSDKTATKVIDIKAIKNKNLERSIAFSPKDTKNKNVVSRSAELDLTDTANLKTAKDKVPKTKKYDQLTGKSIELSSDIKNIVDIEKHVNRLYVEEKKRIREKYTFKLKGINNKKLDVDSDSKNQVENKNDVSKEINEVTENKEKPNESNASSDKIANSTEKPRTQPIIRTIVEKNSSTKVYKEVIFAKQKPKVIMPLKIKMPVLMKNLKTTDTLKSADNSITDLLQNKISYNIDNKNEVNTDKSDYLTTNVRNPKLSQTKVERNVKKPKLQAERLLGNETQLIHNKINNHFDSKNEINTQRKDNLTTNVKNPKPIQTKNERNVKKPKLQAENLLENKKITIKLDDNDKKFIKNSKTSNDLTKQSKIKKMLRNNFMTLKTNVKLDKKSQSSHSQSRTTSSMKTKSSKKEKRRFKCTLSPVLFKKETPSPPTEVAKWAPNSVNRHTKPYYEAWVNTTLTAISKNNKDLKLDKDNKQLIKTLKEIMEQRSYSPELVHENYLDERYTGKIKVNRKRI